MNNRATIERTPAPNSTCPKKAVQCSADTFVVNKSPVLRMNICGKNRQLRVVAKRYHPITVGLNHIRSMKAIISGDIIGTRKLINKSIFRFGDLKEAKDRKQTEYILIGTLLSFGMAVAIGVIVVYFHKLNTEYLL
ncbi:MAG: hypothetical protein KGQ80_05390 [Bacteroidetes bacterium]|nr:hypothetical protein [Bacteroidota bacterium]